MIISNRYIDPQAVRSGAIFAVMILAGMALGFVSTSLILGWP
jgi:hypothetical protein